MSERESKRTGRAPWMERRGRIVHVGHRGAGAFEPQNTIRSFRRAIECGVDMVETDLRLSADGALVLAHDDEIAGADGRRMAIADHSLGDLRELDLGHGERIATLRQAIDACSGSAALMIDLKGAGFESQLVDLLHETGFRDLVVPGGGESSRRRLRELDPGLPISLSLGGECRTLVDDAFLETIDTDAVTWHHSLLDQARIAQLHRLGLVVFAWTVDAAAEMERLVACGVDGIISNRTDLLMQV